VQFLAYFPDVVPVGTEILAHGLSQPSGRPVPQDIKSIELELEKLLGDFLDIMPRLCPVPGSLQSEHRHAVNLDSSRGEYCMVDEMRALTTKAGGNNND
jgi:hypothetical protein